MQRSLNIKRNWILKPYESLEVTEGISGILQTEFTQDFIDDVTLLLFVSIEHSEAMYEALQEKLKTMSLQERIDYLDSKKESLLNKLNHQYTIQIKE